MDVNVLDVIHQLGKIKNLLETDSNDIVSLCCYHYCCGVTVNSAILRKFFRATVYLYSYHPSVNRLKLGDYWGVKYWPRSKKANLYDILISRCGSISPSIGNFSSANPNV